MLPHFHYPQPQEPAPWWRKITDWLEEWRPIITLLAIVVAVVSFIYWLIPNCPHCDEKVHPMDAYCSSCGQQLRIEKDNS